MHSFAPGAHTPSSSQLPLHAQLAVHSSVPQLPQGRVEPAAHTPWPVQLPLHWQPEVHDSVPQLPQGRVVPGEQTPSPVQVPQVPGQLQLLLQVCH